MRLQTWVVWVCDYVLDGVKVYLPGQCSERSIWHQTDIQERMLATREAPMILHRRSYKSHGPKPGYFSRVTIAN